MIHIVHIVQSIFAFIRTVAVVTRQSNVIFFDTGICKFRLPIALTRLSFVRQVHIVSIQVAFVMNLRLYVRVTSLNIPLQVFLIPVCAKGYGSILINVIDAENTDIRIGPVKP